MTYIFTQAKQHITDNTNSITAELIKSGIQCGYLSETHSSAETWNKSTIGLSTSLCQLLSLFEQEHPINTAVKVELDEWQKKIFVLFILHAQMHKKMNVDLHLYLGLLKHYRQVYKSCINKMECEPSELTRLRDVIDIFFDNGEIITTQEYQSYVNEEAATEAEEQKQEQASVDVQQLAFDIIGHQNKLLSILENITFPILIVDAEGFIRHFNQQAYQLLPVELQNKPLETRWLDRIDADTYHISHIISNYDDIIENSQMNEAEDYHISIDINEVPYELAVTEFNHIFDDSTAENTATNTETLIFLRDLSNVLAYEMELAEERKQRMLEQQQVIDILGELIESRSGETGLHVRRVAHVAAHLATLYGLEEAEVDIIKTIAPLHDVGKVAIPDSILNKTGKLTPVEFDIIKTHSELGYRTLSGSQSQLIQMGSIIAHEHHEKWNGTGYPCGKAGEDIHLYARIVAIADVFDALLCYRPYKAPWPAAKVLNLFKEERGKHFDPTLTDIFVDNFEQFIELHTSIENNAYEYEEILELV